MDVTIKTIENVVHWKESQGYLYSIWANKIAGSTYFTKMIFLLLNSLGSVTNTSL